MVQSGRTILWICAGPVLPNLLSNNDVTLCGMLELRENASKPEGRVQIQIISTNPDNSLKSQRDIWDKKKYTRQYKQKHKYQMENKQELEQKLWLYRSQTESEWWMWPYQKTHTSYPDAQSRGHPASCCHPHAVLVTNKAPGMHFQFWAMLCKMNGSMETIQSKAKKPKKHSLNTNVKLLGRRDSGKWEVVEGTEGLYWHTKFFE